MTIKSPTLFGNEIPYKVRSEYLALLASGREDKEIEQLLMDYYAPILGTGHEDEPSFWFAVAYCEWKKGRLSEKFKNKALECIENGADLDFWKAEGTKSQYKQREKVLKDLKEMLMRPQPPAKKIKKRRYWHCPWPVGSLLAYRITSEEKLKEHPLYNKYALLRVVKILKISDSRILEDELYNESMFVALYGWVGDEIPSPEIIGELEYIPIMDTTLPLLKNEFDLSQCNHLSEEKQKMFREIFEHWGERELAASICLVLNSKREWKDKITYLDCDLTYQEKLPKFFKEYANPYVLVHCDVLDEELSQRLMPFYYKE